jgi:positive regulator of sigma E activity
MLLDHTQPSSIARAEELSSLKEISLSGSAAALYLLVSALIGFLAIRLLTSDEIIIASGTIVVGVLGMWILALYSRLRLIAQIVSHLRAQRTESTDVKRSME